MAKSAFDRALQGVQWVHLVVAALPLLYLASMLQVTASTGFQPDRSVYPTQGWDGETKAKYMLDVWRRPRGKILTVWGLIDSSLGLPLDEQNPMIILLNQAHKKGVKIRICSSHADEVRDWLPADVQYFDDPIVAAVGCNAILQVNNLPPFDNIDLAAVAKSMVGQLFYDLSHKVYPPDVDAAGLHFLGLGSPQGPPWLDPDLQVYIDFLAEKIAPDESVLLLPTIAPRTVAGRARWFLHLNYQLFPRRFYIYQPFDAAGASVQFRQWVLDYQKEDRWGGRARWEPKPRERSKITGVGAARSMVIDEMQAIQDLGIDWVSFFSMGVDFRLQDWETVSAADAIQETRKN